MSILSKAEHDYINLGVCIINQAQHLGIETDGVPMEGIVVRIAEAARRVRTEDDTEWEYEVSYSSASAPSLDGYRMRRTSGVLSSLEKAQEFAGVVDGALIWRRTKGVEAGPWETVEDQR